MRLLILFTIVMLPFSIVSCGGGLQQQGRSSQWALVRIDLDRTALRNAGSLPLFENPGGALGAGAPRAVGSLVINERGRLACRVNFIEPTIALGGGVSTLSYEAVNFFGDLSEDGKRAFSPDLMNRSDIPKGTPTELLIEQVDRKHIRVRSMSGPVPLPYIFEFEFGPDRGIPIHIPYVR